jgi:hypothetical protein
MAKKKRSRKKIAKKPKTPDYSTHLDEQMEGAVMDALQKIKPYCNKGVFLIHSPNDRWKVVTFGHGDAKKEFESVLASALNIGARALWEGSGGTTSWEA